LKMFLCYWWQQQQQQQQQCKASCCAARGSRLTGPSPILSIIPTTFSAT
jgi:hypothetical protein